MTGSRLPALTREVATFAAIGVVSTLAYARDRAGLGRDHLGGLVVLIGANGLATVLRFVILRAWIARGRRPSQTTPHTREALS